MEGNLNVFKIERKCFPCRMTAAEINVSATWKFIESRGLTTDSCLRHRATPPIFPSRFLSCNLGTFQAWRGSYSRLPDPSCPLQGCKVVLQSYQRLQVESQSPACHQGLLQEYGVMFEDQFRNYSAADTPPSQSRSAQSSMS